MTPKEEPDEKEKSLQTLEEICENTRAIRRVVNRILDQLHKYQEKQEEQHYDPDTVSWEDLYDNGSRNRFKLKEGLKIEKYLNLG